MTRPVKIHRQDRDHPSGTAVCGREVIPERLTADGAAVTCFVCTTFAPEAGIRRSTLLDSLAEVADDLDDVARVEEEELIQVGGRVQIRALHRLASLHLDAYRKIYRDELTAAIAGSGPES